MVKRKQRINENKVFFARLPWDYTGLLASGAVHPRDIIWPMRYLYAAAKLEQEGFETTIIDGQLQYMSASDLAKKIVEYMPGTLILDVNTPDIPYALRLSETLKPLLPDIKIWATGQHPSYSAEQLVFKNSCIDGSISGEIYESIVPVAQKAAYTKIPGATVWRNNRRVSTPPSPDIFNPDDLPPINPGLLDINSYRLYSVHIPTFFPVRWGFLQTSWGCPFNCSFCSQTLRVSFGKKWRGHSVERVLDDIERYVRDYNLNAFYFTDDVVTLDEARILEISEEIIRRRLKVHWVLQTHLAYIEKNMFKTLKRAGCAGIKFGVESGDKGILKKMHKKISHEKAIKMSREIKKAGLSLTAYYMIGFPGETKEQMEKTFRIARKINSDMIQVAIYTPYPTSEGFELLQPEVKKELLDYPQRFSHYNSFLPINLTTLEDEELLDFQRDFYLRYYLSPIQALRYLKNRGIYTIPQGTDGQLIIRALGYLLNRVP